MAASRRAAWGCRGPTSARARGARWRTSACRGSRADANMVIVTRAGLSVAFDLEVSDGAAVESLSGVFSWVAAGLDGGNRRDRVHFDLGMNLARAEELLTPRLYELGTDP